MPKKKQTQQKISKAKKDLAKLEIKNKQDLAKLRAERDQVLMEIREKEKIAKLKEEQLKDKIKTDKKKAKEEAKSARLIDKKSSEVHRKEIVRARINLIEEKKMHKKQISLFRKEINATRQEYVRARKQRELELKEEWAREKQRLHEMKLKLNAKFQEEKLKMHKKVENQKAKLADLRARAEDAINAREAELAAQRHELQSLRLEKKMQQGYERAKELAQINVDKKQNQIYLETILEEFKELEMKLEAKVAGKEIKSNKKVKKAQEEFNKILDKHQNEIKQLSEENKNKIKSIEEMIYKNDENKDVNANEFQSVFDEKPVMTKQEKENLEVLMIKEYGKSSIRHLNRAEADSKVSDIKKYKHHKQLKSNIEQFREIIASDETPVDFRTIIKYMLVYNGEQFDPETVEGYYNRQIVALQHGESIEFGKGFLNPQRHGKARFVLYAGEPSASVSSLFAGAGRSVYIKTIEDKLKAGASIRIAKGLIVKMDEDKIIKVFHDTNYVGA